jgi:hypothetical protein
VVAEVEQLPGALGLGLALLASPDLVEVDEAQQGQEDDADDEVRLQSHERATLRVV